MLVLTKKVYNQNICFKLIYEMVSQLKKLYYELNSSKKEKYLLDFEQLGSLTILINDPDLLV